ncbi:type II toxin-antitoxin system VapC family toxin [Jannaschia sp. M317]|uniref:type II toxin-antitoxin system VapC family toxin n=1 Tax=Jannaschia sp. M317 TaxID=2867011 RepID=UPI0021A7B9BC|nr:type II toxin-antitoxin system VapC family toxin [Jannaschia sp. M317]UWQ19782.1 type II toxin-antitoxin system VapC family toxin [Jannaschia sp. M317]
MIVIDTNVVSELMRPAPARVVLEWFEGQDPSSLYLSAISEAELRRGVAILPEGRRRDALRGAIDAMVAEDFAGRVLPFDGAAAVAFATVFAERRAAGRPISFPDCQIAATARAHGAMVATRNTRDFGGCGIEVVNPWEGAGG